MKFKILFAAVAVAGLASPLSAQAQGIPDGVAHGAYVGNQEAGPIGAVVGGAVGGVVGGVEGLLGIGPAYASYPYASYPVAEPPRMYYGRHGVRHSYRHVRHTHTNS